METYSLPLLHCYRCVYSWRPVKTVVRMCPRCKSRLWNVPKVRRPPFGGSGLGIPEVIGPRRKEIVRLARRHGARNVRVFGSVARGEATRESDLDLLVSFDQRASLLDWVALEEELKKAIGRRVEVVPEESLRWYVAPQAMAEAVPL